MLIHFWVQVPQRLVCASQEKKYEFPKELNDGKANFDLQNCDNVIEGAIKIEKEDFEENVIPEQCMTDSPMMIKIAPTNIHPFCAYTQEMLNIICRFTTFVLIFASSIS